MDSPNSRTALKIAVSVTLLCSIFSASAQPQGHRTVDVRNQLAPVPREQLEAARFSTSGPSDGVVTPFPLALTLQSISPVSELNGKAIVELFVLNTSNAIFRLPVSREMKILHWDANVDRRMLVCSLRLTHETSKEETIALGSITFSSSGDPSSVVELQRGESILYRFEADFQLPWEVDAAKWKDGIRNGMILSGVMCTQERFIRPYDAPKDARVYGSERSQGVRTNNVLRLSLKP
jgi:hypothetical protein